MTPTTEAPLHGQRARKMEQGLYTLKVLANARGIGLTATQLADEVGEGKRTIYRLLEEIERLGIGIERRHAPGDNVTVYLSVRKAQLAAAFGLSLADCRGF